MHASFWTELLHISWFMGFLEKVRYMLDPLWHMKSPSDIYYVLVTFPSWQDMKSGSMCLIDWDILLLFCLILPSKWLYHFIKLSNAAENTFSIFCRMVSYLTNSVWAINMLDIARKLTPLYSPSSSPSDKQNCISLTLLLPILNVFAKLFIPQLAGIAHSAGQR